MFEGFKALLSSHRHGFGDEDEVAGVLGAVGPAGVVRVKVFDCKARAGEQVLGFEAKKVSQGEGVDKPFLAAVGVSDIVDQLMGAGLLEPILDDSAVAAHDPAAIRRDGFGLAAAFLAQRVVGQEIERRVEDIEYQAAVVGEMAADDREARELVVDGDQVLEGPEGDRGTGFRAALRRDGGGRCRAYGAKRRFR